LKVLLAARGQNRDRLMEAVSRLGHSVGIASGGPGAARSLRRGVFDLVFLDEARHDARTVASLAAIDPEVTVVVCVPRTTPGAAARWARDARCEVLLLPPHAAELARILDRAESRKLHRLPSRPDAPRTPAPRRLEAADLMAAAIAHEINSPLDGAVRFLRFATECLDDEPLAARAHLEQVRSGLTRIATTVRELLRFVREGDAEAVDLRACLDEAVAAIERERPAGGAIRFQIQVRPRSCRVPAGLRLALANLLRNARDAAASSVRVTVRRHQDRIAIHVLDDGPGVPGEVTARPPTPFLTTKPGGTGLGLALSHAAALRCGASLRLRSRGGKGTVARIVVRSPVAVEPEAR
jgi:signal transduction histidine kinase